MADRIQRVMRRLTTRRALVCIGHSHIEIVRAAAVSAGVPLEGLNFWHFAGGVSIHADGSVELAPEIRARLVAPLFSLVGGAVHLDIGLFDHPRPYDFVWPERQDLPLSNGAELVPYDAIYAAMQARTQPYLEIIGAIRAAIRGPMFHMESPPTYADETVPPNAPDSWTYFRENPSISPVWLRYKLWRVHSGIVRAYCTQANITFVPHPPEVVDAQGLLVAAFHGLIAHANQAYGALVVRQMQDLSDGRSVLRRIRRVLTRA
jgi:hypothetical protein